MTLKHPLRRAQSLTPQHSLPLYVKVHRGVSRVNPANFSRVLAQASPQRMLICPYTLMFFK